MTFTSGRSWGRINEERKDFNKVERVQTGRQIHLKAEVQQRSGANRLKPQAMVYSKPVSCDLCKESCLFYFYFLSKFTLMNSADYTLTFKNVVTFIWFLLIYMKMSTQNKKQVCCIMLISPMPLFTFKILLHDCFLIKTILLITNN